MPEHGTPTTPDLAKAILTLETALQDFQHALRESRMASQPPGPVFQALRQWRTEQARAKQVPPYVIATDQVLRAIEAARPKDIVQLQAVRGISPAKASQYGEQILQVVAAVPS